VLLKIEQNSFGTFDCDFLGYAGVQVSGREQPGGRELVGAAIPKASAHLGRKGGNCVYSRPGKGHRKGYQTQNSGQSRKRDRDDWPCTRGRTVEKEGNTSRKLQKTAPNTQKTAGTKPGPDGETRTSKSRKERGGEKRGKPGKKRDQEGDR